MSDTKKQNITLKLEEVEKRGQFIEFAYKVHRNGLMLERGILRGVETADGVDSIMRRFVSSREKQA